FAQAEVYDYARFFPAFFQALAPSTHGSNRMSLTRQDVENIALLARLSISEAALPVYVDSLSKILSFAEQLNGSDTRHVEPMAHPLADQVRRLRDDVVLEQGRRQKYQRNSPRVGPGLYLVPKVIE